jgi:hypothetical protein
MKVRELIYELSKQNPDAEVVFEAGNDLGVTPVNTIIAGSIRKDNDFCGGFKFTERGTCVPWDEFPAVRACF